MKSMKTMQKQAYISPECFAVEALSEGLLCGSFVNEEFGDSIEYTDGTENKGWI